jgi:hypothetical protein
MEGRIVVKMTSTAMGIEVHVCDPLLEEARPEEEEEDCGVTKGGGGGGTRVALVNIGVEETFVVAEPVAGM